MIEKPFQGQAPAERIKWGVVCLTALFLVVAAFNRTPENALASTIGIAVAVPAAAAAALRGLRPPVPLALNLVAGAGVVLAAGGSHASLGYFGLCSLAFLCVLSVGPGRGHIFGGSAVAFLLVRGAANGDLTSWLPWIAGVIVSALGAGLLVHEQQLLAQLQAAQADLAQRTRVQERARIARDLHDVIAHSLTVSLLHISAARMAVQHDPADADRALAEAERLGRESLDEVRAIVGMTRTYDGDGTSALVPTPGLDSLQELIERYRSAGARISAELQAGAAGAPATVGSTAYRIAQEALTNAARHAAGSPVELRLTAVNGSLELDVLSVGPFDAKPPSANGGNGLHTMRERAEAVGGALEAGPTSNGDGPGWRVHASLPLAQRSAALAEVAPDPGGPAADPLPEWPCGRPR